MKLINLFSILITAILALSLCGCSGSAGGPYSGQYGSSGGPFGNLTTVTSTTGITLTPPSTPVGNNSKAMVTAKVFRNGLPLSGALVTFNILAPTTGGVATIDSGWASGVTDVNGLVNTLISTGASTSTTNVLISATVTINSQVYLANTFFWISRGASGIITFGTLSAKSATVNPTQVSQQFLHPVYLKLTDGNGNPRVGVPIALSSIISGTAPDPTGALNVTLQPTNVITDAAGGAMFNSTVTMPAATGDCSVIYKAATNDTSSIEAYAAGYYSLTSGTSTSTSQSTISLATDRASVDANNGQVLVTATLRNNGAAVSNVDVSFTILAPKNGAASIDIGMDKVPTDSNGVAKTWITSGNSPITTNVIVQGAATTTDGKTINATASFQIVRGVGVITIPSPTPLTGTVPSASTATAFRFAQMISFKVTDSLGNPRVGVPVTLDIYSQSTRLASVVDPSDNGIAVITDASGSGIFNLTVTIPIPSASGFRYADSIVFKAATNDTIPLTAYVGLPIESIRAAATTP